MHVLVAGCGWLGEALARALVARGDRVTGIRRDPARAAALAEAGIEPLALDLAAPGAAARLPRADAYVACQSATGDSEAAYRAAYLDALAPLLAAAAEAGAPLVYTGSTGVFGQRDGSEVDEETPPAPASATGAVLLEAERRVAAAAARGARAVVLRLSGLYGPGRTGIADRVRAGVLALGPGDDAWMNFCHRDDAVSFAVAALERAAPGAILHGSDAHPARRREVVEWIAARLGMTPPRTDRVAPGAANRRIGSARTRAVLGVTLRHPSFREGLAPLLRSG